jgi:hypothetical protein
MLEVKNISKNHNGQSVLKLMNYTVVGDPLLALKFTIDKSKSGGESRRLNGEYAFVLVKQ